MRALSITILLLTVFSGQIIGQESTPYEQEIMAYQAEMNEEFRNPETSPLPKDEVKDFKELPFFPIDSNFRVKATIRLTPDEKPFEMNTSTERKPIYRKYAEAYFSVNGKKDTLHIFQNMTLIQRKGFEDYLFIPFSDNTNGFDTYGGGRYLDLRIGEGDVWVIDFNKAYNPYCAYDYKYSCPIPPRENYLDIEIKAGVKYVMDF